LLTVAKSAGVLDKVEVLTEGERLLVGGEVRTAVEREPVRARRAGPEAYSVG
jgi:hypothetical protein